MNETLEEVAKAASNANKTFTEQTASFINWFKGFLTWENLFKAVGAAILIFIIYLIYRFILKAIKKIPAEKTTPRRSMVMTRIAKYAFYIIELMFILSLF